MNILYFNSGKEEEFKLYCDNIEQLEDGKDPYHSLFYINHTICFLSDILPRLKPWGS